jgi:hypothetical protein
VISRQKRNPKITELHILGDWGETGPEKLAGFREDIIILVPYLDLSTL